MHITNTTQASLTSAPLIRTKIDADAAVTAKNPKAIPADADMGPTKPHVAAPQEPIGRPAGQEPQQEWSLRGLMAAWGQENSQYDLDGDGTVNVNDLLLFLNHWNKFNPQSPQNEQGPVTAPAADEAPAVPPANEQWTRPAPVPPASETQPAPVVQAAVQAAVQVNAPAINKVKITQKPGPVKPEPLGHPEGKPVGKPIGKPLARDLKELNSLSKTLFNHLSEKGFAKQPPVNTRELIDALNLSPQHSQHLLKQFAERYPGGLGVNVVG